MRTPPEHLPNGARRYRHSHNGLTYEDVFVGGNPFAGMELLYQPGRAFWAMVYYGRAIRDPTATFRALRACLKAGLEADEWFRGPPEHRHNEWVYACECDGTLEQFTGREHLTRDQEHTYEAILAGGLVDWERAL